MFMFKSGIIVKDSVFLGETMCSGLYESESHSEMLKTLKIKDTTENEETLFVRAELSPKHYLDVFSDIDKWKFNVDQDIVPKWFIQEYEEKRMRCAVKEWAKTHIFVGVDGLELTEGNGYCLKDCTNVKIGGTANVHYIGGNSTVLSISGNATVDFISDNVKIKFIYGNVKIYCITGNVKIDSITGNVKIRFISGSVKTDRISGNVEIHSIFGNVKIGCITGNVKIDCIYGNVEIDSISGDVKIGCICDYVKINHIYGDVEIESVFGNVKICGIFGNVRIDSISGDVIIYSISGNVIVISLTYIDWKNKKEMQINDNAKFEDKFINK